jgi:asparagine synthase (glutamine-hydrolysing)
MRIVQNELNLNSFFCYPNLSNLEKDLTDLIFTLDEPSQSMSALLGANVFKLAHSHNIKVLINGQGADEYLGGYGQFANLALVENLKKFQIKRFFASIKGIREHKLLSYSNIFKGLFLPVIRFKNFKKRNFGFLNISDAMIRKSAHPFNLFENSNFTQNGIINNQIFENALPRYLRWEDRNSMKNSIEARVPFLDHRLVDFVASLPIHFMENGGVSKLLLRNSLSDYLPTKIKNRKDKKGFITPEEHWVKIENPELFRKLLENSIKYSNGLINENFLDYFDKVVNGKLAFDYTYWRYIQFGYWMKSFDVKYVD